MKISILTPSYNYARFIDTALASTVGSESAKSLSVEHIVMDGRSTDDTRHILESTAYQNLQWRSEKDEGQSDALNKALECADGEIIGWLNADDFYLPGTLETVNEVFEQDPHLDVLIGDTFLVDENARFMRLFKSYSVPRFIVKYRGTTIMSTSFFVRKSVLGKSPFDIRLRRVMDWDLFLSIMETNNVKVSYVNRPFGAFRFHDAQVTHTAAEVVKGLPEEHHLIYRKHGIAQNVARLLKPVANLAHKIQKFIRGHALIEKRSSAFKGIPVLDEQGRVDAQHFERIFRKCYLDNG